jgi:hypothetical protein
MRRLIPLLLILGGTRCCAPSFAQLPVFPAPVSQELSKEQLAKLEQQDFVRTYNAFAEAANDLTVDLAKGLAPVKKAQRVAKLWDKVRDHPGWPGGRDK